MNAHLAIVIYPKATPTSTDPIREHTVIDAKDLESLIRAGNFRAIGKAVAEAYLVCMNTEANRR